MIVATGDVAVEPTRSRRRPTPRRRRGPVELAAPWLFLLPALFLALLFKYIPVGTSVQFSFQKVQPFLGNEFVGLANYGRVVSDPLFREALLHTVQIALITTVSATVIGLLLALLLEGSSRALWLVRTMVFLPVVTAVAVTAEIWRILMYPDSQGFVNSMLARIGIDPLPFFSSPATALGSIVVVCVWSAAPYNMVIFLAGLAGIDRSLYEAAAIDGAGVWRRLWYVVVPALRPALSIVLTLAAIRGLRIFTEVFILTGGGPSGATEVWMTRLFAVGTVGNDVGLASAAAVLLLIVTAALTITVNLTTRRGSS